MFIAPRFRGCWSRSRCLWRIQRVHQFVEPSYLRDHIRAHTDLCSSCTLFRQKYNQNWECIPGLDFQYLAPLNHSRNCRWKWLVSLWINNITSSEKKNLLSTCRFMNVCNVELHVYVELELETRELQYAYFFILCTVPGYPVASIPVEEN